MQKIFGKIHLLATLFAVFSLLWLSLSSNHDRGKLKQDHSHPPLATLIDQKKYDSCFKSIEFKKTPLYTFDVFQLPLMVDILECVTQTHFSKQIQDFENFRNCIFEQKSEKVISQFEAISACLDSFPEFLDPVLISKHLIVLQIYKKVSLMKIEEVLQESEFLVSQAIKSQDQSNLLAAHLKYHSQLHNTVIQKSIRLSKSKRDFEAKNESKLWILQILVAFLAILFFLYTKELQQILTLLIALVVPLVHNYMLAYFLDQPSSLKSLLKHSKTILIAIIFIMMFFRRNFIRLWCQILYNSERLLDNMIVNIKEKNLIN